MMRLQSSLSAACACILLALVRPAARAAPACAGPTLRAEETLGEDWLTRVAELRGQLAAFGVDDSCPALDVVKRDGLVLVEIRLADGRSAARSVDTPDALRATVEALLISLPLKTTPAPPAHVSPPIPAPPQAPPSAPDKPRLHAKSLDVGVAASTRMAGQPLVLGYGLAAHVNLSIGAWLIGSWLRWDFQDRLLLRAAPRDFTMASFLLGAFAGRRFALGRAALDVVAGPNVMVEQEEAAGTDTDIGGEMAAFSLGGGVRLLVPVDGEPGFFGLLSGELVADRLSHKVRTDPALPALPAWSATCALGVSWSVQ